MKMKAKLQINMTRIVAGILGFLLLTPVATAQAWYNPSWQYRSPVTATNPGTNTITDIQVNIKLRTSNFDFTKAKSDGSDIFITDSDGTTPLAFWIESWVEGDTASIWTKLPSLPAQGATIYIYYGNSGATSASNGINTFEFFDDFESGWSVTPQPPVWVDKAAIPTPSADLAASVYNNKLYTFGGYGINHRTLNTSYAYDPAADNWTYLAPMPTKRWGMVSVEYNGKIYVFGGQDRYGNGVNLNEVYDPTTDSWTSRALGNPLPMQDYGAEGVVHPDVIYFQGGRDGYEYWMVYTPYPPTSYESPCIVRSHDGIRWTDAGISNPVIPLGNPGSWNDQENPDPDFIYVSDFNKWFMVWDGGDVSTDSRKIALAYSSDGKTWTQYDGISVNGNAVPVILSGDDNGGQAWERDGFGHSQTCTPSLYYEGGIFYLFYAEEVAGNNRGQIGLATFTWNNETDDIVNLQRNIVNPIISLPDDAIFKFGGGHLDVSKFPSTNTYRMYLVRELLGPNTNYELSLLTSSSLTSGWTNQGKVIERGASGEWDDNHIYRSSPLINSAGEIVVNTSNNTIRMFYSAFDVDGYTGIGIADISLSDGAVVKLSGTGPQPMPAEIANQGLMGVKFGDKIHLFYKAYHYEYDPVTDIYVRKNDVPHSVTWATCANIGNYIYLVGGYSYEAGNTGASAYNQELNVVNDTWEEKTPIPRARYGSARENPVINGKIYVTHGWNDYWFFTANYVFDPLTNVWEQKGSANHPRDGVICGVVDNKLYVIGGRNVPSQTYGLIYNELYDPSLDSWTPTPPPAQWTTSSANYVYTDNAAKYQGNEGLVVRDAMDGSPAGVYFAESTVGFGQSYALDFDWNLTTLGGISDEATRPEAAVRLTEEWLSYGSIYFYQQGVPSLQWLHYSDPNFLWTHLQSSTYDTWHKVTIVRNGTASRVVFDGNLYSPLQMITEGTGKFRFAAIRSTQYVDNVRVRKWVGFDPVTVVGIEQNGGDNHWTGNINSDWNNPGNWSSGLVPGSTDDVSIFRGTYYPIVAGSVICKSLTIEPAASITIETGGTLTVGEVIINSAGTINSGSLIVNGTLTTGSGSVPITYNRFTPTGLQWHYATSPVSSAALPSGTFYRYNEVTDAWDLTTSHSSGIGYLLRTDGTNITFTGSLFNSDLGVPVTSPYSYNDFIDGSELNYDNRAFVQSSDNSHSGEVNRSLINYGGGGWNLLGNPYTSSLSVASFIAENYSSNPSESQFDPNYVALYLYDGSNYYYVSNSTGWPSGTELDQDYVQAGQGFFVLAMNDGAMFSFKRNMQRHNNDAELLKSARTNNRWPGFQLKINEGGNESITTVVFNEEMTVGLDPGYDIGLMNSSDMAIYTALVKDNGINFARQALPINGCSKNVIPIGIDYSKGGRVTFSAEIEPLRNLNFILEDRDFGVFTDLKSNKYTVTIPAKTCGTGRFFIHVTAGRSTRPLINEAKPNNLRIWGSHNYVINIQGPVSEKAICEVYDLGGHKLYEIKLTDIEFNTFSIPSQKSSVCLVKVTDGLNIVTSKVVFP